MIVEELDDIDLEILRILQENCKMTTKELALKIHLSTTPTFERQKRLERLGYIRKYVAILDSDKLKRGFMVFSNIRMRQINKSIDAEFKERVSEWDEVTECYNVSGDCDYILKVCVPNMHEYQQFVINRLGTFNHISHIQSVFVMDTIKITYAYPV